MNSLKPSQIISLGCMLFAISFGAGNFIFPPMVGYEAGTNFWPAVIGFLLSGVGIPFLGIVAIALFNGNIRPLVDRVHPLFGATFMIVLFLCLGPLFAIPRTATIAVTIGVNPFLPAELGQSSYVLAGATFMYFFLNYHIAIRPHKIMDILGKVMTPLLVIMVGAIIVKAFFFPGGDLQAPSISYVDNPFSKGFMEGFLTMDAIGSLLIGGVVVGVVNRLGIKEPKSAAKYLMMGGMLGSTGLALIYVGLTYLGATSGLTGVDNGGVLLSTVVTTLFGKAGLVVLALAMFLACISTSTALTCAFGTYFSKIMPKVSYKTWILIASIVSFAISNVGLSQIISLSLPVLNVVYPVVIVCIALAFFEEYLKDSRTAYVMGIGATFIVSLYAQLFAMNIAVPFSTGMTMLPLFQQGLGWILPGIVGTILGYVLSKLKK